jgi:hypothetical protein
VNNGNVSNLQGAVELKENVSPSFGTTCGLRWWLLRWWLLHWWLLLWWLLLWRLLHWWLLRCWLFPWWRLCRWLRRPISVFLIVARRVVFSDGRKSCMGLWGRVDARRNNNGRVCRFALFVRRSSSCAQRAPVGLPPATRGPHDEAP